MNLKVGDTVKIKSLDWYNENKDICDTVVGYDAVAFGRDESQYCGMRAIIAFINNNKYEVNCNGKRLYFRKWMFEPKEEEVMETRIDLSKNAIVDPPIRCWVKRKDDKKYYTRYLINIDDRRKNKYQTITSPEHLLVESFEECILNDPNIQKERWMTELEYLGFIENNKIIIKNKADDFDGWCDKYGWSYEKIKEIVYVFIDAKGNLLSEPREFKIKED